MIASLIDLKMKKYVLSIYILGIIRLLCTFLITVQVLGSGLEKVANLESGATDKIVFFQVKKARNSKMVICHCSEILCNQLNNLNGF